MNDAAPDHPARGKTCSNQSPSRGRVLFFDKQPNDPINGLQLPPAPASIPFVANYDESAIINSLHGEGE